MAVTTPGATQRPAIVTVDDDPEVSRAVARDLRRKYGEWYRIVRAESGADALDALRQMKLRGNLVAVILADYRMPQAVLHDEAARPGDRARAGHIMANHCGPSSW